MGTWRQLVYSFRPPWLPGGDEEPLTGVSYAPQTSAGRPLTQGFAGILSGSPEVFMRRLPTVFALTLALAAFSSVRAGDAPSAKPKAAASGIAANCEIQTGTRIRHKTGDCNHTFPLRTYTQADLQSTGETNLAQALRQLDPIFH